MDPIKIVDELSSQILATLKVMSKAKTPEERLTCSKTVKNLSDSISVFFELIQGISSFDGYDEDDEDEEGIPF
ncbi:MAG: hypothetical protein K8S62_06510 [Candidatus Sabulitectum sp.]|nr:hypothetical protein [Candidatus Sabulitectum sp.]